MYVLFIASIVIIIIGLLFYKDKQYKNSAYYHVTKNSYWFMNAGTLGEYLLYKSLQHFEKDGGKFLFNIYLPKGKNETTEIDILLINTKGLFVFESKNYSGWIFGNEAHRNWTQSFPQRHGDSYKQRFYNPIMQNSFHISHLRRVISENLPVWSIIVFSDRCTLKSVTVRSLNVRVVNRYHVASSIAQICDQIETNVLTDTQIQSIYNKIYPYT